MSVDIKSWRLRAPRYRFTGHECNRDGCVEPVVTGHRDCACCRGGVFENEQTNIAGNEEQRLGFSPNGRSEDTAVGPAQTVEETAAESASNN